MADVQTSEVDEKLHHSTWHHAVLNADRSSEDEQLLMRPVFRKDQNYERGGRLIIKIKILFYGDNS
jgi:hypothetical protein